VEELSSKPFSDEEQLTKPPWMIVVLESSGSTIIDFVFHHALYDGESLDMLFEEIETRVRGEQVEERVPFERLLPQLLSTRQDERFFVAQLQDCQSTLLRQQPSSPLLLGSTCLRGQGRVTCYICIQVWHFSAVIGTIRL
jgi:hypothetical protein